MVKRIITKKIKDIIIKPTKYNFIGDDKLNLGEKEIIYLI